MKKNIVVTILTILVVGMSGYLVYDKILLDSSNKEETVNTNESNNDITNEEEYKPVIPEISKVFEFTYSYFDLGNAYCGEEGTDDFITTSKQPSNGFYGSKQFKTYDEMIGFLKKYMTEDVLLKKNSIKKEFYTEQNGKLYCEHLGKGSNIYQPEHIIYQINSNNENNIKATVAVELSTGEDKDYLNYEVTFEKLNNNWIITSYEQQS